MRWLVGANLALATVVLLVLLFVVSKQSDGPWRSETRAKYESPSDADDVLLSPQCQLSVLHHRLNLTVRNARGQQTCQGLPLTEHASPTGRIIRVMHIGWRPEFDSCSVGVFMPRVDVAMTRGARGGIKSILYHRTTPVTLYIVVTRNSPAVEQVTQWFRDTRFPFLRVVLCDVNAIYEALGAPLVRRGHGGVHPYFVVSYMVAHLWALPGERVLITTASDQIHTVDILEVYKQFLLLANNQTTWFGAIRGFFLDMWRARTTFAPDVEGLANAQVIHVRDILREESVYMAALVKAINILDNEHGYGDMEIMTALHLHRPDRMAILGCFSMADTAGFYLRQDDGSYTTLCESLFHSAHMNVQSTFVDVPEDVRFMSLLSETMRSIPDGMISRMCPFQLSQAGSAWRWPQGETWGLVGELNQRVNSRKGTACKTCLGSEL